MKPAAVRGSDPVGDGVLDQRVSEPVPGLVLDAQAGGHRYVEGVVRGVRIQIGCGLDDLGVEAATAQ